jgi:sirohydrochlorin ferrochelatase
LNIEDSRVAKHILLVIGHGTRSAQGLAEFETFAGALGERLQRLVRHCYLELAKPDMVSGLHVAAAEAGPQGTVTILPLFLGAGDHYKRDVPEAIQACLAALGPDAPHVRYAAPLGPHPKLIDLLNIRIGEALTTAAQPLPRNDTALLVAGRGSLEADSNDAVLKIAHQLGERQPWRTVLHAFQAVQHPTVPEAVQQCHQAGAGQVVVAPYLLFGGRVYDDVCATSEQTGAALGVRVVRAAYLGTSRPVHPLLLDVAAQRCVEAEAITP